MWPRSPPRLATVTVNTSSASRCWWRTAWSRLVSGWCRSISSGTTRARGGRARQPFRPAQSAASGLGADRAAAADRCGIQLIEDLADRGLLDETLVIMMGEFGRTPRFNKDGGRDHWPQCYQCGRRHQGRTDLRLFRQAGRDASLRPCLAPEDLLATLYHLIGLNLQTTMHDLRAGPFRSPRERRFMGSWFNPRKSTRLQFANSRNPP